MSKTTKTIMLVILLLGLLLLGFIASNKLLVFDVCEAKAAEVISEIEATKMKPSTKKEQQYFGSKMISKDSWPSAFSHEVMRCQMDGEEWPYFR